MRTNYANGDRVNLSCGCDGCNPSMINGVLCHEQGCPYAWKDEQAECMDCGAFFYREGKYQTTCVDCRNNDG